MANLAALFSRKEDCENRAQLILIGAFALAAIILALAILVNSAIFTENLATRNENVESTEALEYRHEVTQYTADIIEFVNENNETDYPSINENVTEGIEDAGAYTGIQQVERGAALSLDFQGWTRGSRLFQNSNGEFRDNQSNEDWTLAENVDNTRAFELNITEFRNSEEFSIIVNDTSSGTDQWAVHIDGSAAEITVDRSDIAGDVTCSFGSIETVDITGATVNGEPCPALRDTPDGQPLQFGAGVDDDYAIEFEDGNNVVGNYSLVVDRNFSNIDKQNYTEAGVPGDSPFVTRAMYSATVALDYETSRVRYQTVITIAAGEPE